MTIKELQKLAADLKRFTKWYWPKDTGSSEESDAHTTIQQIEQVIKYTPKQIEKDRIEEQKRKPLAFTCPNWVDMGCSRKDGCLCAGMD